MFEQDDTTMDATRTSRNGHGDFFVAVLAGAAIGAAIAMLYTPFRGREAREMIGERLQEGMNRGRAVLDKGRELAEQGRDLAVQGRQFVATARETVNQAIADGREAYRQVKADA